jgi:hypothetical protein
MRAGGRWLNRIKAALFHYHRFPTGYTAKSTAGVRSEPSKPLADARGSDRSHDRKGVIFRKEHKTTRSQHLKPEGQRAGLAQ